MHVSASVIGGAGGDLDLSLLSPNRKADGVSGAAGTGANLTNAVSGSTTGSLNLYQSATGGAGGSGLSGGSLRTGGAGGNAVSVLAVNDNLARSLSGTVNASGGAGGTTLSLFNEPAHGGAGGNATAYTQLISAVNGANVRASANAAGGAGGIGAVQGNAGTANATASASAIGSGVASANSTAVGAGGGVGRRDQHVERAVRTEYCCICDFAGWCSGSASAMTQTSFGGAVSLPNTFSPGQSFSAINAFTAGPSMIAFGSMGAGGTGASLTYQTSANFVFNAIGGGIFLIDPLSNFSLGSGFDSALFQVLLNGSVFESHSFNNLASAQAFFSPSNLIDIQLADGLNNIQLAFNEIMSGGEGFGFSYRRGQPVYLPHLCRPVGR